MARRKENDLIAKINQLSRDRSQRPRLQEELNKINIDELCTVLSQNISRADAAKTLGSVLSATPESAVSSGRKFKIISSTLKCLRKETMSVTLCSDIVTRILLDLTKLSSISLVTLADQSVQSITSDNDINMIWRDVLPECLTVLSQRGGSVVHCGTSMPVAEFKEQCLRALCQCEWPERVLGQIAAMFNDIALSKSEHRQVVNKACSRIILMAPDSLPPLLHQLLRLCSSQHLEVVLSYLNKYFNLKLYSKLNVTSLNQQNSDATTFEIEDFGSHTTAELTESAWTCMYHLTRGVVNTEFLRKVLRGWPSCTLLASPFLLNLAFVLSETGPQYRDVCLAMVKSSIQLSMTDSFKTIDSAWLRSILDKQMDVKNLLKILLNESTTNKQLTTPGLLHLSFALLNTSPLLGREHLAHALWSFARLLLVRLAKAQPETSSTIVTMLGDRLAGDSTASRQYSETLLVLCQLTPLSIMDCTAQLQSVLENCILNNCDWLSSSLVLEAVQPMVKISPRVRDTLVMVCRKGLFSRDSSTRCLAVSGFLSLLRHMKLSLNAEMAPSSQTSVFSGGDSHGSYSHSYLTQISIDLHATQNGAGVSSHVHNQAVCHEIVSILRRCLTQDATVKQVMYTGLYDCVKNKPSLHGSVLELLAEHLDRYLVGVDDGGDSPIPINFEKCVFVNGVDVKLVEPLGFLLYLIQQFLHADSTDQDMEDGEWSMTQGEQVSLKVKLKDLTEKLAAKMARCTLLHFNLESDHGLGDLTPESRSKALKVQQILATYEALMGYRVSEWSTDSENPADKLYALFKIYTQILDHCKISPKQKKALNKSEDEGKEGKGKSQKSQKAGQKSQTKNAAEKSKKQNGVLKLSNLTKDKAGPFKPLNCLWNLRTCSRAMKLLYGSTVSWCTSEQLTKVRTKRDLHRFVLRSLQTVVKDLGVLPGRFRLGKTAVQDLHRIGGLLYERCITRFTDICDFDEMTALACLECFRDCILLPLNPNLGLDIAKYFQEITKSSESPLEQNVSAMLEQIRVALESHDGDDSSSASEEDAMTRRLKEALIAIVPLLLEKVLPYGAKKGGGYQECKELTDALHWYENYFRTSEKASVALISPLLAVTSSRSQEWTLLEDVVAKLSKVLQKVDEDDDSHNNSHISFGDAMPCVTDSNAGAVLVSVCQNLSAQCSLVDYALARVRALFAGSKLVASEDRDKAEKDLRNLERALVVQLCPLVSTVSALSGICVPIGAPCERLLGLVARTYGLLAMLTKHLVGRVGTGSDMEVVGAVRFEKLLKICGRKFSTSVDNLITYAESAGAEGKAKASRVLKDTRDIPKIVFETEQFNKFVIVLDKRCKMNLQQYLSHGTARDFRIQAPILKEALGKEGDEDMQDNETVVSEMEEADAVGADEEEPAQDDIDFNDADTTIISSGGEEENAEEEERSIQPKKKQRKK